LPFAALAHSIHLVVLILLPATCIAQKLVRHIAFSPATLSLVTQLGCGERYDGERRREGEDSTPCRGCAGGHRNTILYASAYSRRLFAHRACIPDAATGALRRRRSCGQCLRHSAQPEEQAEGCRC
jgi:hypothetical protein